MTVEKIVLQSAGSLSVAVTAMIMMILQLIFILKKNRFVLYGWSFGISFSATLYAIGIFLEYNTLPGALNQWAGRLEFSAIVFLIHILYGFTFDYFGIDGKRYHQIAGIFHLILIILIWRTDIVVADQFVSRNFIGLAHPFVEPAIGVLGPCFVLYGFVACLTAILTWIRRKDPYEHYKRPFLLGIGIWTTLGLHDGMAALGATTVQYLMEYGFLFFAIIVLWIVSSRFYDLLTEDKYRMITEFVNDGILVVQDGITVFENPACRLLFGQSMIGRPFEALSTVLAAADKDKFLRYYASLIHAKDHGKSIVFNVGRGEKNESLIEFSANTIQYKSGSAVLAVLRDITERIRKAQELKESEEKVVRLKKMESLGLLAGGVAHDLNNVLSGIASYPALILMDLPEESGLRQPLLTIQDSGRRAAAIVNELLTIARGAAVEKKVINLNRIIDEYVRSPEHKKLLMFHPRVRVETHLDSRLLNINGSSMHFSKAVMNLVSNAAEAIDGDGNVVVSTANRYLDHPLKGYCTVPEGEYTVLTVEDNGPGIDREDLDRIFEPFYTKKVMGRSGTGLGLTLVWNVVQDHDCFIDVISSTVGTRFDIYCQATRQMAAEASSVLSVARTLGHGERILVVDDVKSQREITCLMLNKLGYRTDSVPGGDAAVDYIKEHGGVDLLLLDMIMDPGISGRETFERVKAIQPDQKAIVLSGFSETDDVKQTLEAGAARYLRKPITIDVLGQAVKDVMSCSQKQH